MKRTPTPIGATCGYEWRPIGATWHPGAFHVCNVEASKGFPHAQDDPAVIVHRCGACGQHLRLLGTPPADGPLPAYESAIEDTIARAEATGKTDPAQLVTELGLTHEREPVTYEVGDVLPDPVTHRYPAATADGIPVDQLTGKILREQMIPDEKIREGARYAAELRKAKLRLERAKASYDAELTAIGEHYRLEETMTLDDERPTKDPEDTSVEHHDAGSGRFRDQAQSPEIADIMRHFRFGHLSGKRRETSQVCAALAEYMADHLPRDREKTAGLRKLLEAKDCFVRAIGADEGD
jgi:hypothetical protein